jgi:hypothetical protein
MDRRSPSHVAMAILAAEAHHRGRRGHPDIDHSAAASGRGGGHVVIGRELLVRLDLLIQEFCPRVSAGVIVRAFGLSVRELQAAGLTAGLPDAAEAMARYRLNQSLIASAPHIHRNPVDGGAE